MSVCEKLPRTQSKPQMTHYKSRGPTPRMITPTNKTPNSAILKIKEVFYQLFAKITNYIVQNGSAFSTTSVLSTQITELEKRFSVFYLQATRYSSTIPVLRGNKSSKSAQSSIKPSAYSFLNLWNKFQDEISLLKQNGPDEIAKAIEEKMATIFNCLEYVPNNVKSGTMSQIGGMRTYKSLKHEFVELRKTVRKLITECDRNVEEVNKVCTRVRELPRLISDAFLHEFAMLGLPQNDITGLRSTVYQTSSELIRMIHLYFNNGIEIAELHMQQVTMQKSIAAAFKYLNLPLVEEENKKESTDESLLDFINNDSDIVSIIKQAIDMVNILEKSPSGLSLLLNKLLEKSTILIKEKEELNTKIEELEQMKQIKPEEKIVMDLTLNKEVVEILNNSNLAEVPEVEDSKSLAASLNMVITKLNADVEASRNLMQGMEVAEPIASSPTESSTVFDEKSSQTAEPEEDENLETQKLKEEIETLKSGYQSILDFLGVELKNQPIHKTAYSAVRSRVGTYEWQMKQFSQIENRKYESLLDTLLRLLPKNENEEEDEEQNKKDMVISAINMLTMMNEENKATIGLLNHDMNTTKVQVGRLLPDLCDIFDVDVESEKSIDLFFSLTSKLLERNRMKAYVSSARLEENNSPENSTVLLTIKNVLDGKSSNTDKSDKELLKEIIKDISGLQELSSEQDKELSEIRELLVSILKRTTPNSPDYVNISTSFLLQSYINNTVSKRTLNAMAKDVFECVKVKNNENPEIYFPDICSWVLEESKKETIFREFCPILSALYSRLEPGVGRNAEFVANTLQNSSKEMKNVIEKSGKSYKESVFVDVFPKLINIICALSNFAKSASTNKSNSSEIIEIANFLQN